MQRIVVVGITGSGKSTLGMQLAQRLNLPFVELDALHWEANWTPAPLEVFRARVDQALAGQQWVVGGNYSKARDLIWIRADTLIWLDYPLYISLWRLLRRSIRRILTQEDLWGTGNRETWRNQFFSRDALFLWALRSARKAKHHYPKLLAQPEYAHLNVCRLKSPLEAQEWLNSVEYVTS
jgi:adenylate kinase family enzyme